jgi:hypothetical protein
MAFHIQGISFTIEKNRGHAIAPSAFLDGCHDLKS